MKNEYFYENDYAVIVVNRKGVPYHYMVDKEDINLLESYKGTLHRGTDGYCYANLPGPKGRKSVALHRMLMKPEAGMVVDHINRNTLDNRRDNLRVITTGQNTQNIYGNKRSETGIRGVSRNKKWGKPWRARVRLNGKDKHLGSFDTIEEAEQAAINARKKYLPYSTEIT